jgi:hypothetical protein
MTVTLEFTAGFPAPASAAAAHHEQDLRRALEAYHFFYPAVSMEALIRGTRRAGAVDNESAMSLLGRPRHRGFTLNSDTPYAGAVLDLHDGPMVVDLPPGPLTGMVDDHFHRWVTDLGLPGPDGGRGGRHAILPPGWDGKVPAGHRAVPCDTWLAYLALRTLPLRGDLDTATRLLTSVRVYPLGAGDGQRDGFRFLDRTAEPSDTTCLGWEDNLEFWRALHTVVDAEPAAPELRVMLGTLAELGIQAGRRFDPDARAAALLGQAARRGRDEMLVAAFTSRRPDRAVWPDRAWEWVGLRPENGNFERAGSLDVEARDRWFAQAIGASPAMFRRAVGQGSLYWLANRDAGGAYLDGSRQYRLTVPLPVPASLFWSVTCYDARTRSAVVTSQDQAALSSLSDNLTGDGESVDLRFGPEPPGSGAGRWIQTEPGRGWFCYFRIYGPERAVFDGSWRPGDITACP